MVDVVKTISEFVAGLDLSGKVLQVSDDGTNTTLMLENSYHLRAFMPIKIDGADYKVLTANASTSTITIEGVLLTAELYQVPNPFFFWGSFYLANVDFGLREDEQRLPMFYMNQPLREDWGNYESQIVTPDFYFLIGDHANYDDWQTADYYEKRQIGLTKLAWAIREQAQKHKAFGTITSSWTIEKLNKLGDYLPKAGADNSLFNHTLTGVGIRVSIPIYNQCNC